jgi:peptidoglycan/LPS O-acetylase OafA/YrhL
MTLAEKMEAASNRPAGFDYMRIALATAVIVQHAVSLCYGRTVGDMVFMVPFRGIFGTVLPMFFALSGFLVAGSLERNKSVISFLGLRVIRLVPALVVEVLLSALVLGPLVTTVQLRDYFSSHEFFAYALNIIGDIQYTLPGVFQHNPFPSIINGQLWTIPSELKCYILLASIALLGIAARRLAFLVLLIIVQAAIIYHVFHDHPPMNALVVGLVLVLNFLAGLLLFRFRDRVPLSFPLFLASTVLVELLMNIRGGDYFAALPIAYCAAFLGTLNPPRQKMLFSGDYSYGVYLYGFPIQQAAVALIPLARTPVMNFVIAYPLAFALAIASWHIIEKPASKLKKQVFGLERWALRFPPLTWHSSKIFVTTQHDAESQQLKTAV